MHRRDVMLALTGFVLLVLSAIVFARESGRSVGLPSELGYAVLTGLGLR